MSTSPSDAPVRATARLEWSTLDGRRGLRIPVRALPVGVLPEGFRAACPTCHAPPAVALASDEPYGFLGVECARGHVNPCGEFAP